MGTVQYCVENFSVYGAVKPTTGESFFLELPQLNTVNVQSLLQAFAHHDQDTLNRLLMDHGRWHTAQSLVSPDHVVCRFLPPYSPELKPIERRWPAVQAQLAWVLAWVLAAHIGALAHQVEAMLRPDAQAVIRSLTAYPDVVQAVHALCS
jgi:hypothetical protein